MTWFNKERILSLPNAAQKWEWLPLLGAKSLAPKLNFSVSPKTVERKILIKNGITFILKSVHKEPFSWKQSLSLKQRIFVRTKHKITQKTYLSAIFLDVVMLQRLDTFISPPKFKSCIRPWLSQTHGDCFWSLGQLQKNTIKNSAPFLWH